MKRRKRLAKKFIIRRVIVFIVISMIFLGGLFTIGFNVSNSKVKLASIRNNLNVNLEKEELNKFFKSLNIVETDFKWSGALKNFNKPNKIVIHHSADNIRIDEIHNAHKEQGWSGIGYHYFINSDGTIFKGRPDKAIGAHAKGENNKSIGICMQGNFEEDTLSKEQLDSLVDLSSYIVLNYDIESISGHRDVNETLCPGENIKISEIEKKVKDNIVKILENNF